MTDNLGSIQSLLKQVQEDPSTLSAIPTPEEVAQKAREDEEKFRAALEKFKSEVLSDPLVIKRMKKFRREGVYAIKPWQWSALIVGIPLFVGALIYFVHLFSNVTRSNMAIRSGLQLVYAREPAEALSLMQKAIDLGASAPVTKMRFGMALADMEYYDSAVRLLDHAAVEAVEINDIGTMALAASRCAEIYFDRKNMDEAIARIKPVLDIDPRQRNALIMYGRILLAQSQFDNAVAAFIGSIERNPTSLMPRWYLREAYTRQGKQIEAKEQEEYLLLAVPSGDENIETLTGYAELLVSHGRSDEAERILLSLLGSTLKPLPDVLVTLGHLALEKQDYPAAGVFADSAILIAPWSANGYVLRSVVHYHDGRGKEAIHDIDKALSLEPLNPFALYTKGCILLYDLGLYHEARRLFYKAEENGFDGAFLWYNIAASEYFLQNGKASLAAIDKIPEYMRENSDIVWTRANIHLLNLQIDTALALYEKLATTQSRNPGIISNMGVIHELRGDSAQAMQLYWKAGQIAKNPQDADTAAVGNVARILAGGTIENVWNVMHSEIALRPRGVPDPFRMKRRF